MRRLRPCVSGWLHALVVLGGFSLLYGIVFLPRIMEGATGIAGDVFAYYLPVFLSPKSLWTDLLYNGFPSFADPQFQMWYPIARLCAVLPYSWEVFIVSAYVLASCFSYGYIYRVTSSRLAAVVGGVIYGLGGFMVSYWGYSSVLHGAAWIPLLIWSLDCLRTRLSGFWLVMGSVSVAGMQLSGHPQIMLYGLMLGAAYVLFFCWSASVGRWQYLRATVLLLLVGIGLTGVQLIPTLEFAQLSVRSEMTFKDFVSYSLLWSQLVQLSFPYYRAPNLVWSLFCYMGVLAPLLIVLGAAAAPRRQQYFWLGILVVSFLLALGDGTGLAQVMYQVPVYNKFRAPVRMLLGINFSASILAGYGVLRLQQVKLSARRLKSVVILGWMIITANLIAVLFLGLPTQANYQLAWPIGLWTIGVLMLIAQQRVRMGRRRRWLRQFIAAIIIFDLISFIWLHPYYPSGFVWLDHAFLPPKSHRQYLVQPNQVTRYRDQLVVQHQRLLPMRGVQGTLTLKTLSDIPPATSLYWGVPSASGYGPLILSRYQELTQISGMGDVTPALLNPADRSLDLLTVRYIVTSRLSEQLRWVLRDSMGPESLIYENQQVLPRAWLVPETRVLSAPDILRAIQTSQLPDGTTYDPNELALVEQAEAVQSLTPLAADASVEIQQRKNQRLQIRTQSKNAAFLVLSDAFYPGWQVKVDGQSQPIYQTNYVQRGVKLSPGIHTVEYFFDPLSLKLGSILSAISLVILLYWLRQTGSSC